MTPDDEKLFADLWAKQSDLFLKLVALVPIVELGILASWYALMKDGQPVLARWTAGLGVIVMVAAWFFLRRTSHYIGHFRTKIERLLVGARQSPITGRSIGVFVPALCVVVNAALVAGLIVPKKGPSLLVPKAPIHSN